MTETKTKVAVEQWGTDPWRFMSVFHTRQSLPYFPAGTSANLHHSGGCLLVSSSLAWTTSVRFDLSTTLWDFHVSGGTCRVALKFISAGAISTFGVQVQGLKNWLPHWRTLIVCNKEPVWLKGNFEGSFQDLKNGDAVTLAGRQFCRPTLHGAKVPTVGETLEYTTMLRNCQRVEFGAVRRSGYVTTHEFRNHAWNPLMSIWNQRSGYSTAFPPPGHLLTE